MRFPNVDILNILFFTLNILVKLNTGYYFKGELVMSRKDIAKHFAAYYLWREIVVMICVTTNPFGQPFLKIFFIWIKLKEVYAIFKKFQENF